MPDTISYDASKRRLLIGHGFVENVTSQQCGTTRCRASKCSCNGLATEKPIVSGLLSATVAHPLPLGDIQPDYWLSEYTTELLNLLNVLGGLLALEPVQEELLARICAGPTISAEQLTTADALTVPSTKIKKTSKSYGPDLFGNEG